MRGLSSFFFFALLCLAAAGAAFAQQPTVNPDPSPDSKDAANSPCHFDDSDKKVVHVKESGVRGVLVHKVNPSYPAAAKRAHIEGTVLLCAAISKEGKVENLTAASGPTELISSSVKAVKKWRYKPYLLDGEPVAVETEIRVNYALTR